MEGLQAGVAFLFETWRKQDESIRVPNYVWYHHYRLHTNRKQPRASGGVGFLMHNSIEDLYDVDILNKDCDGIMAMSLVHKLSNCRTLVIGLYVPPENSIYGDNADVFYDNVMNMLYENNS